MEVKRIFLRGLPCAILSCMLVSCFVKRNVTVAPPPVQQIPSNIEVLTAIAPQQQPVTPAPAPEPVPLNHPLAPSARTLTSLVPKEQQNVWTSMVQTKLDSLCNLPLFQTTQLGVYIYDLTARKPLYALNAEQRMRPASCQKLITCISALHYLGNNYRFQTRLYLSGTVSRRTLQGDVIVQGGMDPMFSNTDLGQMLHALRQQGIDSIAGKLYVDLSMKDNLPYGWGWCWDDDYGPYSALMLNARDEFAPVWLSALRKAGIALADTLLTPVNAVPKGSRHLFTISHPMSEVMEPVLKKSDNIYAECIFFQIAAHDGKKQASHKDAREKIDLFIASLSLDPSPYLVADGSGLSQYNYLTPQLLVQMLNYAYNQRAIYNPLYKALPVAGVDGTLAKRMKGTRAENNVRAKTGSVTGVSTLSGYLKAANGHDISFCIMNQGLAKGADGRDFQDKICTLLCGE